MNAENQIKRLYVVGHPVAHSKSPAMHNAAYEALGLPWHYEALDCVNEHEARSFFEGGTWLGLNVTTPFKPTAFKLADVSSGYAAAVQGANVLVRDHEGKLHADNTDGRGCVWFLQRFGANFEDAQVVVCGTGPTSQSIMYAAACAGARSVSMLGRSAEKASAVLENFFVNLKDEDVTRLRHVLHAGSYSDNAHAIEEATIILDATPLGMQEGDPAPFDTRLLHKEQTVFDAVYGHGPTALVVAARAAGCKTHDGCGMLVAQAVLTVYDICEILNLSINLEDCNLYDVMAKAAGFEDCII